MNASRVPDGGQAPRSALLVGVGAYLSDDFPAIPTVHNDLRKLRQALEASGYKVEILLDSKATQSYLSGAISDFLNRVPEDATVVVHLDGHGLNVGGRDYFVPHDAFSRRAVEQDPERRLLDLDFRSMVDGSKAGHVFLLVDACRSVPTGSKAQLRPPDFDASKMSQHARLTTVFGCQKGQFCHFDTTLGFSFFTEALVQALRPECAARTIDEVVTYADGFLQAMVERRLVSSPQKISTSIDHSAPLRELCDGNLPLWSKVVESSKLWERAAEPVPAEAREAVLRIATTAWSAHRAAEVALPQFTWADVSFPERFLSAVGQLLGDKVALTPAETAMVIAAPFVREAVMFDGLRHLASAAPFSVDGDIPRNESRQALEVTYQTYSRVYDKAKGLTDDDRQAVLGWMVNKHLLRDVRLWRQPFALDLARDLARALVPDAYAEEIAQLVLALALNVAAYREDLEPDPESDKPSLVRRADWPDVRADLLSALMAAAGLMAIDIRQWGEPIANHIGVRDPLRPAEVLSTVAHAQWHFTTRESVDLMARCPHPALHLALEEQVIHLNAVLALAHDWRAPDGAGSIPSTFPKRATAKKLRPQLVKSSGRADESDEPRQIYETPLLTFRLAHDEIRDLLMGVRLYGDPTLAIRELYQNALDACRYRRARASFAGRDYVGRISFSQGVDADGRAYIECQDNGVGMGRKELETLFSRAGRRFVTSPDFLWEQAKWQSEKPSVRLWPNSRYGIGVFSYFMVADEIVVISARSDKSGADSRSAIRVDISSSGSLFRIQSLPAEDNEAGTMIRLYLREQGEGPKAVSALRSLRDWLWFSEFEVKCADGEETEVWPADVYHAPTGPAEIGRDEQRNAWLVAGEGRLLADGIATSKKPFGYVVNLSEDHAAVLSVDRNTVESWDKEWVKHRILEVAARLEPSEVMTYTWLWQLAHANPVLAQVVWERLAHQDVALPITRQKDASGPAGAGGAKEDPPPVLPVREVGAFPMDTRLLSGGLPARHPGKTEENASLSLWTAAQWQGLVLSRLAVLAGHGVGVRQFDQAAREAGALGEQITGTLPLYDSDIDGDGPYRVPASQLYPRLPHRPPALQPVHGFALAASAADIDDDFASLAGDGNLEANLPARVIGFSKASGRTMLDIRRAMQPLVAYGIPMMPAIGAIDSSAVSHDDNRIAEVLHDTEIFAPQYPERTLAFLAETSHHSGIELNFLIDRLSSYRGIGMTGVDLNPGPAGVGVSSDADWRMLANLAIMTWNTSERSWLDLAAACHTPGGDVERLSALLTLLPHPAWDERARQTAITVPVDGIFLYSLSRFADSRPPWFNGSVTVDQLANHAEEQEWILDEADRYFPLGMISDDWERLEEMGVAEFWHSTLSLNAELWGLRLPPVDDVKSYFAAFEGDAPRPYDRPNYNVLEYMANTFNAYSMTSLASWIHEDDYYDDAEFDQSGERPPAAATRKLIDKLADTLPPVDRLALSPSLTRDDDKVLTDVSVVHVAAVASFFDESIGQAMTRLRRIKKLVDFELPRLSARMDKAMTPSKDDLLILSNDANGLYPWLQRPPSPLHLAKVAARARKPLSVILARTTALHPLHPVLPTFDARALETTRQTHPEPRDLVILSEDLRINGRPILEKVEALHVVKASALLTETCGDIVVRLEQYAVLGLVTPPRTSAGWVDRVASWQDLTVLTQEGRGVTALPAGPVPGEHIRKAALTIDESPAQVVERLRAYASLFEFEL